MSVSPNTFKTIESNEKISVVQIQDQNEGIYEALNRGIRAAPGSHVIVIYMDDLVDLAGCISLLRSYSEDSYDVIFGDTIIKDDTSSQEIFVQGSTANNCFDQL